MEQRGFVSSVTGWLAHPFNSQGSALNWFLWVGLILVAILLWNTVLNQITE